MVRKKPDIMKFAGIFSNNRRKWKKIAKRIYRERHAAKMRDFNLFFF